MLLNIVASRKEHQLRWSIIEYDDDDDDDDNQVKKGKISNVKEISKKSASLGRDAVSILQRFFQ